MITLSEPWAITVVAVPAPTLGQLMGGAVHVEGYHLFAGIDSATEENAGMATVEERGTEEMLCGTMALDT